MIHTIFKTTLQKTALLGLNTLSEVDYSVATKVSDNVATVSNWAYEHNQYWLIEKSVETLEQLDNFGSFLIGIVAWLVHVAF